MTIDHIYTVTSIILTNESIEKQGLRTAYDSVRNALPEVAELINTYPEGNYSISGSSPRTCSPLKSKKYNELNGRQRANFNAIKKIYNEIVAA